MPIDLPIRPFKTAQAWQSWLFKNHAKTPGLWLRFYKKASGVKTVVYAEALEVALCYGWIDSQVKSYDAASYIQKFTPRGPKSVWSKINVGKVERLIKEKKMRAAGLKAVHAAKQDGRWAKAYDSPATMQVPADFLAALSKNKKAKAFFDSLSRANHYAIAYRLHEAKRPETREKRFKEFLNMMAKGQKIH